MIISGDILKGGFSKSTVCPCEVCCLRVKGNSVLCAQCDMLIHKTCVVVKRVMAMCINFFFTFKEIVKKQRNRSKSYVMKWKQCTYLCGRLSAGGGCVVAVAARTRCVLI